MLINFLVWIIVGGIIGWLASMIMRRDAQQGILLNIVVGIVGAFLAGLILTPFLGVGTINESNFSIAALAGLARGRCHPAGGRQSLQPRHGTLTLVEWLTGETPMPQTPHTDQQHRAILQSIAHRAMLERGLLPDFSAAVLAELDRMQAPVGVNGEQVANPGGIGDLTDLPWASIDNDDSRDLDQLTVAEVLPADKVKIRVAVADVDALVKDGSAIDEHARHNTTSVYTAAKIFPMLPEKLSTDLTSLNFAAERLAVVVEMVIGADGALQGSDIYRARVRNHAKLAYNSVAAWLEARTLFLALSPPRLRPWLDWRRICACRTGLRRA